MNKTGLSVDVLAEFYVSCLDKLTMCCVMDVLFRDYVDFCFSRNVQPCSQGEFIAITDRFARKVLTVIGEGV